MSGVLLLCLIAGAVPPSFTDAQIIIRNSNDCDNRPVPAGCGRQTLTFASLTCQGAFITPYVNTGNWTYATPVAVKVTGSTRSYYMMDGGNGQIIEFAEPTLLPCSTARASLNQATTTTNWGAWPYNFSTVVGPAGGINYDATSGRLYVNFSGQYVNLPTGVNTISAVTFGASSLNLVGCWAPNARSATVGQPMGALGMLQTPSWFRTANGMGSERLLLHGGMYASATSHNSYGPSLEGVDPANLTSNACSSNVVLPTGRVLARYPANSIGPNCADPGLDIGCTPPTAPTNPQPAKMAFTGYSQNLYPTVWDPYGGFGYWGDNTQGPCNWYDDGTKSGVVCPLTVVSGWLNESITSVSSFSNPNFTLVLPNVGSHDGQNLQAGDKVWVQSCTVGVDSGCLAENMQNYSIATITAVNTTTKVVSGTYTSTDPSTGTHSPVVGGKFYMGVKYAYGAPFASRFDFRMQIYAPSEFSDVLAGAATYTPQYNQEFSITNGTYPFIPQFGYPGGPSGGVVQESQGPGPTTVQIDSANKKIIICTRAGRTTIGVTAPLCTVLGVS